MLAQLRTDIKFETFGPDIVLPKGSLVQINDLDHNCDEILVVETLDHEVEFYCYQGDLILLPL